ncbi:hypothetical protein M3J09_012279 [Ascochyta lentis]
MRRFTQEEPSVGVATSCFPVRTVRQASSHAPASPGDAFSFIDDLQEDSNDDVGFVHEYYDETPQLGSAESDVKDDMTEEAKLQFDLAMQQSYRDSETARPRHVDPPSDGQMSVTPQTLSNSHVHRDQPSAPNPAKQAGNTNKKRKRGRGRQKEDKVLNELDMHIFMPMSGHTDGGLRKPLSALPPACAGALDEALRSLFNKNFDKICTMTKRSCQQTYVDSGMCAAYHLISKGNKKGKSTTHLRHTCVTCTNALRPCARLEWTTADTDADAAWVFYPLPGDQRPNDVGWTDIAFWIRSI